MRLTQKAIPSILLLAAISMACDAPDSNDQPTSLRYGAISEPEIVASFNSDFGEAPESVLVDWKNNKYISMSLTGEIRKIDKDGIQSSLAWLPLGDPSLCVGPFPPIMGALAQDFFRNIYVPVNSCDENKGVYRISPAGTVTKIASLAPEILGNGIAVRFGHAYLADSGSSKIWRTPTYGNDGAAVEEWLDTPLLADPNPFDPVPGANGLQFYRGSMYVANAATQTIVEIPLVTGYGDLSPGTPHVKYGPAASEPEVESEEFPGCDDFAFDRFGGLYCTTDPFQLVVRINEDGTVDEILTEEDGLDGPTAAMFGKRGDRTVLYISNASFPFFPSTLNFGPSLMSIDVGVPGYPVR